MTLEDKMRLWQRPCPPTAAQGVQMLLADRTPTLQQVTTIAETPSLPLTVLASSYQQPPPDQASFTEDQEAHHAVPEAGAAAGGQGGAAALGDMQPGGGSPTMDPTAIHGEQHAPLPLAPAPLPLLSNAAAQLLGGDTAGALVPVAQPKASGAPTPSPVKHLAFTPGIHHNLQGMQPAPPPLYPHDLNQPPPAQVHQMQRQHQAPPTTHQPPLGGQPSMQHMQFPQHAPPVTVTGTGQQRPMAPGHPAPPVPTLAATGPHFVLYPPISPQIPPMQPMQPVFASPVRSLQPPHPQLQPQPHAAVSPQCMGSMHEGASMGSPQPSRVQPPVHAAHAAHAGGSWQNQGAVPAQGLPSPQRLASGQWAAATGRGCLQGGQVLANSGQQGVRSGQWQAAAGVPAGQVQAGATGQGGQWQPTAAGHQVGQWQPSPSRQAGWQGGQGQAVGGAQQVGKWQAGAEGQQAGQWLGSPAGIAKEQQPSPTRHWPVAQAQEGSAIPAGQLHGPMIGLASGHQQGVGEGVGEFGGRMQGVEEGVRGRQHMGDVGEGVGVLVGQMQGAGEGDGEGMGDGDMELDAEGAQLEQLEALRETVPGAGAVRSLMALLIHINKKSWSFAGAEGIIGAVARVCKGFIYCATHRSSVIAL